MKIIIFSDTHGNYLSAIKAIEAAGHVDLIIHLGDEMADAIMIEEITGLPVTKVPGNCDFASQFPRDLCKILAQRTFFLTHGDKYNVKSSLDQLHKEALQQRAHVVLYGHSHVAAIQTIDDILFINPGCMCNTSTTQTCAMLTVTAGEATAEIVAVENNEQQSTGGHQQPQPQL